MKLFKLQQEGLNNHLTKILQKNKKKTTSGEKNQRLIQYY